MVGKKGKSGRKPNNSGWLARAQALYIPSYELGIKKGKKQYQTVSWFRLFKKIYGSRTTSLSPYNWQEKIRVLIRQEVVRYTDQNGWFCNCSGDRLHNWHFKHDPQCMKCDYVPEPLERHRTEAQLRANTPPPRTPKEELKVCPSCEKPLSSKQSKFGRLWFCESCA